MNKTTNEYNLNNWFSLVPLFNVLLVEITLCDHSWPTQWHLSRYGNPV